MKAAFWRFAHKRYQIRKPSVLIDILAFTWFGFWALVYGSAVLAGWVPSAPEALAGFALIGLPLAFGVLHRRIRIEASKAPDALYRKRIETGRG